VVGVRFDRRGDRISLARLHQWISDRVYAARPADRPFRSARSAQFWFEWHQHRGSLLSLLNALSLTVYGLVVVWAEDITLAHSVVDFLFALGTVNILAYPILAAILVNTKERFASQDLFWATRPVGDNTLLLARLRVAATGLVAGWCVWLAGAVVLGVLLRATGQSAEFLSEFRAALSADRSGAPPLLLVAVYIGWIALVTWTALGIVGSLHMTGRRRVAALWIVALVAPTAWSILARQLVSRDRVALVESAAYWALGILCLAGTALAYWAALRKGRVPRWLGWAVSGVFLALCPFLIPEEAEGTAARWHVVAAEATGILSLAGIALVWAVLRRLRVSRWLAWIVVCECGAAVCLLCMLLFGELGMELGPQDAGVVSWRLGLGVLPLLPLALGPLAVAWNRHR